MYNLKIIIASVREGRKGPAVANWIYEFAKQYKEFNVEMIDLKEVNLPMMDEPNRPMQNMYTKDYTKKWSAMIAPGDAYILVTPEYNYSYPPSLKNALDYLYYEWIYKPVGIVSYGGLAAGTRSSQALKLVLQALNLVVAGEVNIPQFSKQIDESGKFIENESQVTSAKNMIDAILKWSEPLKQMREKESKPK